jgi:hypothetical protein
VFEAAWGNNILEELAERKHSLSAQPAWLENPYGLVSLWDFMKEFFAADLFGFGRHIEALSELMERMEKNSLLAAKMSEEQGKRLLIIATMHIGNCDYLQLPASKQSCEEIITLLNKDPCPPVSDVRPLLLELNKRIQVELKANTYFYVSKERSAFYQKPLSGWEATEITFPSVRYDIEEAGKCLTFGRTTAAVFHLMRVIGAGVTALGKSLNEPVLDASHNLTWDNVLSRCVKELGEKFSGKSPEWQTDKEFYAKATATLLAVKDAWRNPSMHEVGQKYTDEEASDIYRAARRFMEQLSTKLKE